MDFAALLERAVPQNRFLPHRGDLVRGALPSGLEYRVLRHAYPPGRVHMHMAVAVGSLHELEDERGLAHFLEHCVFLSTEKFPSPDAMRQEFSDLGMAFGGDLNAHTDFNETVYTFSCPTAATKAAATKSRPTKRGRSGSSSDEPCPKKSTSGPAPPRPPQDQNDENPQWDQNVLRCLELLRQVVVLPRLEGGQAFENEKDAVQSEAQLRHSIGDRVEKAFLAQLYAGTSLPHRMPIGDMNVVRSCSPEKLRKFYDKWYHPQNMCLVVCGDLTTNDIVGMIHQQFGSWEGPGGDGAATLASLPAGWLCPESRTVLAQIQAEVGSAHCMPNVIEGIVAEAKDAKDAVSSFCQGSPPSPRDLLGIFLRETRKQLPDLRPLLFKAPEQREVVFQHDLLRLVSVTLVAILPINTTIDEREYLVGLVDSLLTLVFEARIEDQLRQDSHSPFLLACWDYTDAPSEGCGLNCLSVAVRPQHWREALSLAITEVAVLAAEGVTAGELEWALKVFEKNYRDAASQASCLNSGDIVDEMQADWATGTVSMDPHQDLAALLALAPKISPDIVNARAKEIFNFVTHWEDPLTPPFGEGNCRPGVFITAPEHAPNPEAPVSAADVVEPIRALRDAVLARLGSESGVRSGDGASADASPREDVAGSNGEPFEISAGGVAEVIREALQAKGSGNRMAGLPETLVDEDTLTELLCAEQPRWCLPVLHKDGDVPALYGATAIDDSDEVESCDPPIEEGTEDLAAVLGVGAFRSHPELEVFLATLDNGVRVTFKKTAFEPNACLLQLNFQGGMRLDILEKLPPDSVALGVRSWLDSAVNGVPSHVAARLLEAWGISITAGVTHSTTFISFCVNTKDPAALRQTFSVINAYLCNPTIEPAAFDRQKRDLITSREQADETMEGQLGHALAALVFPEPGCPFRPTTAQDARKLTLEQCQKALELQIRPCLLEVIAVGDMEVVELRVGLHRYIGSLRSRGCDLGPTEERDEICRRLRSVPVPLFSVTAPPSSVFVLDKHIENVESKENGDGITLKRAALEMTLPHFGRYSLLPKKGGVGCPSKRFRVWRLIEQLANDRLFKEVREKRGLTYSVAMRCMSFEWLDKGVVAVSAQPLVEQLGATAVAVREVLQSLAEEGPTQAEFVAARDPLVSELVTSLRTNDYWVDLLRGLQDPLDPRRFEQIGDPVRAYGSITYDEVRQRLAEDLKLAPAAVAIGASGAAATRETLEQQRRQVEELILGTSKSGDAKVAGSKTVAEAATTAVAVGDISGGNNRDTAAAAE